MSTPGPSLLNSYFDSVADYWEDVYRDEGLQGLIYRERMETVLRWVSELGLPYGAAVLDAGCGAGLLAAEMAMCGLEVTGTDSSPKMVNRARSRARRLGLHGSVRVALADAHQLPFADGELDLVVALGLLPWLHDALGAVAEMARVLRPGGWLVVTADNRARLNLLTEPRENPLLIPLKLARGAWKRVRGRLPSEPSSHLHAPPQIDRMLAAAGLEVVRRTTIGYGPFTFLGHPLLSDASGLRVYHGLRALSERRFPALRGMGWHYVVASRKSGADS